MMKAHSGGQIFADIGGEFENILSKNMKPDFRSSAALPAVNPITPLPKEEEKRSEGSF